MLIEGNSPPRTSNAHRPSGNIPHDIIAGPDTTIDDYSMDPKLIVRGTTGNRHARQNSSRSLHLPSANSYRR